MIRGTGRQTKEPGMTQPRHVAVLLIFLIVTALVVVCAYISDFRSKAMGEAQDLMYEAAAYILDCARGEAEFRPDSSDQENYYITREQTLAPYREKPVDGSFTVALGRADSKPLYAVCTRTRVLFGRYVLRSTGVFPKGAVEVKSLEWYRMVPDNILEKEGRASHDETMGSKSETEK